MKTVTGVIVGALIVIVVIMGVLSYQKNHKDANSGSLIIGITDATAMISDVNDIDLSVKKVEVYSAAKGWVTVSSADKSYKLLALNASGKTELYAKESVATGTYDKVRVTLGDAVVNTTSKGDVKATLPSSYVVINTSVMINKGTDTSVKLDVMGSQSLHATSDGEYVFAPVVKAESRSNAAVTIGSDNVVAITGGTVDGTANVGVDLSGTSKADYVLKTDISLQVQSKTSGAVKFLLGGKSYDESDVSGEVSGTATTDADAKADSTTGTKDENGSVDMNLNGGVKLGQ